MKRQKRSQILRDESGIMTLDFIFAFVLVFSLTIVLFALSLSLSVIEITQYVTFAVARNYHAAHVTRELQTQLARRKFDQLTKETPALSSLYKAGWYQIGNLEVGPQADEQFMREFPDKEPNRSTFAGARVTLNAKVLEIRIPFFGNTYENEDGFVTRLATFLSREPTTQECMGFNEQRFSAILQLDGVYQRVQPNGYFVMADNGC